MGHIKDVLANLFRRQTFTGDRNDPVASNTSESETPCPKKGEDLPNLEQKAGCSTNLEGTGTGPDIHAPLSVSHREIRTNWRLPSIDQVLSHSRAKSYPYGSRSLSAQVDAVSTLFPPQNLPGAAKRRPLNKAPSYPKRLPIRPDADHQPEDFDRNSFRGPCLPRTGRDLSAISSPHYQSEAFNSRQMQSPAIRHTGIAPKPSRHSERPAFSYTGVVDQNYPPRGDEHWPRAHQASLSPKSGNRISTESRPITVFGPILRYENCPSSLSRKPSMHNLRGVSDSRHTKCLSLPVNQAQSTVIGSPRSSTQRLQLDKPLPPIPLGLSSEKTVAFKPSKRLLRSVRSDPHEPPKRLQPMHEASSAPRIVHTTVHERWSPAVTHETITRRMHEIREERIVREIHNHEVYHREQPVVDIELLPTRHFVSTDDGYLEIAASDVPAALRPSEEWLRSEIMHKLYPCDDFNRDGTANEMSNAREEVNPYSRCRSDEALERSQYTQKHDLVVKPTMRNSKQASSILLRYDNARDHAEPVMPDE